MPVSVTYNTRVQGEPNKPLTARMRSRIERFPAAVMQAEHANGKEFVKRARELSQGTFSTAILRKMGYPYAVRNPSPPQNPAIINRQTGNFQWRWQYRVSPQAGEIQLTVFNTAAYAKYLLGTWKMIARPILQEVYKLEQPARIERLRLAKLDVLTKIGVR